MAAGKKKKKPTANPARGYATTSLISKTKLENETETASTGNSGIATPEKTSTPAESKDSGTKNVGADPKLHELSPEALEAHLETSELQAFVEKHGPKVKKESTRHAQRLRTERRVLRSQADFLSVKPWLPNELMEEIINLIQFDPPHDSSPGKFLDLAHRDELLTDIWNLRMLLLELNVSLERINEVIAHLLHRGKWK